MQWHTKADFVKAMEYLLNPIKNYYSEGNARLRLGPCGATYKRDIIEMEAFARPLWALGPFFAGGGENAAFETICREGLKNGTDPNHPEYWGEIERGDQRMVEMAPIGLALALVPEKLYDPLSETEKQNVVRWLNQVNEHELWDNNWQFFNVMTNLGLKRIGAPYSKEKMQHAFDRYEAFYQGDGWYRDGESVRPDYYIAFAMHFYSLVYAKLMEREDPQRSALYKERAMQFAKGFIHWFDEDGSAIPYGRSQTYRFAQCCFWSACVFADVLPFELGVIKGLIARHMECWMNRPIFDNAGVLTVGYAYPNLQMAEGYNAPGSPYWSMKAFLLLALPEEHAFWKAEALPMPARETVTCLPHAQMLVQHQLHNTTALRSGLCNIWQPAHGQEKYEKFAYSSYFGFSISRTSESIEKAAPDSMLAFETDGIIRVRRGCEEIKIEDDMIWSKWSPAEGIEVETTLTPTADGHRRKHKVTVTKECVAYDCGFSIDAEQAKTEIENGCVCVTNPNASSAISSKSGEAMLIAAEPNTNLHFPYTVLPAIRHTLTPGTYVLESEIKTSVTR